MGFKFTKTQISKKPFKYTESQLSQIDDHPKYFLNNVFTNSSSLLKSHLFNGGKNVYYNYFNNYDNTKTNESEYIFAKNNQVKYYGLRSEDFYAARTKYIDEEKILDPQEQSKESSESISDSEYYTDSD